MSMTDSESKMAAGSTPSPRPSQDAGGSAKGPSQRMILCKKAFKAVFSHIGLTAMVLIYGVIGAYVFQTLESENEVMNCESLREKYEPVENKSMHNIWNMAKAFASEGLDDPEVEANLLEGLRAQIVMFRNDTITLGYDGTNCTQIREGTVPRDWSFGGSLLFAVTIMTTIGYGNISPQTMWGRIIVIAYALLGIPIMLLCLANIGDVMADMFKFIYVKICCCGCFRKKRKPREEDDSTDDSWTGKGPKVVDDDEEEEEEDLNYQEASIPLTITMGVIAFYLLFGACIFSLWEDWDMMEAAYYCFITISTVGFGDFVPGTEMGNSAEQAQMIFAAVYMLLGLALISMCFSLIQEEIAVKFRMLAERVGLKKKEAAEDEEDDDSRSRASSIAGPAVVPDKKSP